MFLEDLYGLFMTILQYLSDTSTLLQMRYTPSKLQVVLANLDTWFGTEGVESLSCPVFLAFLLVNLSFHLFSVFLISSDISFQVCHGLRLPCRFLTFFLFQVTPNLYGNLVANTAAGIVGGTGIMPGGRVAPHTLLCLPPLYK